MWSPNWSYWNNPNSHGKTTRLWALYYLNFHLLVINWVLKRLCPTSFLLIPNELETIYLEANTPKTISLIWSSLMVLTNITTAICIDCIVFASTQCVIHLIAFNNTMRNNKVHFYTSTFAGFISRSLSSLTTVSPCVYQIKHDSHIYSVDVALYVYSIDVCWWYLLTNHSCLTCGFEPQTLGGYILNEHHKHGTYGRHRMIDTNTL